MRKEIFTVRWLRDIIMTRIRLGCFEKKNFVMGRNVMLSFQVGGMLKKSL